ncbi:cell division protein FtsQ/DivIB [Neotamlana laminarinivorans]|nr:cell division protein FtsQ/DivIB [Tamlana laminarinivorans]
MILLLGLVVFLFAFASGKNAKRNIPKPKINFLGEDNLFITSDNVSKLLIQNYGALKNVTKETLDLNVLENALKSNAMIKNAEVYLSVDGTLNAEVEQKTPIARVSTKVSYYIDTDGEYMPLSSNFSARVPLITGYVEKNNLKNLYEVAQKVTNDNFLKTHVYEIHQDKNEKLYLKLRQCNFMVKLGDVEFIDKKVNNLKAFYKKTSKEKTLNNYSVVNLQFENQVICTKI